MVAPAYRDFLLNRLEGGLESIPYSLSGPIETLFVPARMFDFLTEHKEAIVAILAIIGAVITLLRVLLH